MNDLVIGLRAKELCDKGEGCGCTVTITDMTCGNHRTALVDTVLLQLYTLKFALGSLYRYALLMRMGAYWVVPKRRSRRRRSRRSRCVAV